METPDSIYLRTLLLIERRRFKEALELVEECLASDPGDAGLHHQRALCLVGMDNYPAAREAVEAALGLEPNDSDYHALRACILHHMDQEKPALESIDEALRIDPDSADHHAVRAGILAAKHEWKEAELAARHALSLDPNHAGAATLLSHSLRLQGKASENREQIAGMLHRDPEDSDTHAAAGWSELQAGKRLAAERHFLEALRLQPHNEFARQGLLESFRARSWLYRGYLKYAFFMSRLTVRVQIGLLVGLYLLSRFLSGPLLWLYALFALSSHVMPSVGNGIIALDRKARHALHRRETLDGLVVGGLLFSALVIAVVALSLQTMFFGYLALTLTALAFPLSKVFLNRSEAGTVIYSMISALALVFVLAFVFTYHSPVEETQEMASGFFLIAVLLCGGSTFLSLIPNLNKRM